MPLQDNEGDISNSETASEEILYPQKEEEYIDIGNITNPILTKDDEDSAFLKDLRETEIDQENTE